MADEFKKPDDAKSARRPDILRARDIIPGADKPLNQPITSDIPQFDLAEDIMAEHRRLSTVRRKAPGSQMPSVITPVAAPKPLNTSEHSRYGFSNGFNLPSDPVIADIVARDIERFC